MAELVDVLIGSEMSANRNSAQHAVTETPYLVSLRRDWVMLRGLGDANAAGASASE